MNGFFLSENDIFEGVLNTSNFGRMEIVSKDPLILLDGAHNPEGMHKLRRSLEGDFNFDRLILIIGILKDKNIEEMLSIIYPISHSIIITKSWNDRSCDPKVIKNFLINSGKFNSNNLYIEDSVIKAINHAKSISNKDDLICITGSLFTVGEARNYLIKPSKNIINY